MAMADRQHYALQTIFSFFLGLMVLAFIGVGVNTFYPSPSDTVQPALQKLYDQQDVLNASAKTLTPAEQAQATELQKQVDALQAQQQVEQQSWGLNTSIILVLFATAVMGVSLVRAEQLRTLSNGLLLGGLFTTLYGMGWTVTSGSSYLRFFVVLFALAVAIGLGYAKFVWLRRGGAPPPVVTSAATAAAPGAAQGASALEARVAALEARTDAAAAALRAHEPE
jgi:hypothetical protein